MTLEFQNSRRGIALKNGRLLIFEPHSVTVIHDVWDKPAASIKTTELPVWTRFRPHVDLSLAAARARLMRAKWTCNRLCGARYSPEQLWLPEVPVPQPWRHVQRMDRELRVLRAFFAAIPTNVQAQVRRFPERQFSLLSFCARCPGGLDLLQSSPALALALANSWVFRPRVQRPLRSARSLLRRRQTEQLEWLGFENHSNAAAKILRKVPPLGCTVGMLLYLRDLLSDPERFKLLCHLPRINPGVVQIAGNPELLSRVTPTLLEEVGRVETSIPYTARLLGSALSFARQIGVSMGGPFRSYHDLRERCGDMARQARHLRFSNVKFPPPPLPGDGDEIVPITTVHELFAEGFTQRHCAANYVGQVRSGEAYLYRVFFSGTGKPSAGESLEPELSLRMCETDEPATGGQPISERPHRRLSAGGQPDLERATLMIVPLTGEGVGAEWRLAQVRGSRNQPVSPQLMRRVESWLRGRQETEPDAGAGANGMEDDFDLEL